MSLHPIARKRATLKFKKIETKRHSVSGITRRGVIETGKETEWVDFVKRMKGKTGKRVYGVDIVSSITEMLNALKQGKDPITAFNLTNQKYPQTAHTTRVLLNQVIYFSPRRKAVEQWFKYLAQQHTKNKP